MKAVCIFKFRFHSWTCKQYGGKWNANITCRWLPGLLIISGFIMHRVFEREELWLRRQVIVNLMTYCILRSFFLRWRSHGIKSILCISLDQNLPLFQITSWSLYPFWRDRVTYHIIGPTGSAHKHYVWTNNRIDQPFASLLLLFLFMNEYFIYYYQLQNLYTRVCIFSLKREEKLTGKPFVRSLPNLVISVTFWIQM